MVDLSDHDLQTFRRVAEELNGKDHVPTCPARGAPIGPKCSNRCAVVRCVHRSLSDKIRKTVPVDMCSASV